jgi:hypothetical protein
MAAVLVAGCGGSSKPKQPSGVQAVTAVVKNYLSDLASGNGPAACKLMTPKYQAKVVRGSKSTCAPTLSTLAYELSPKEKTTLVNAKIAKATVKGDAASVNVKGQKGSAKLTKQKSGRWLLSGGTAG